MAPTTTHTRPTSNSLLLLTIITLLTMLSGINKVQANNDLEGFAQWNLNYGSFLVDEGKYLQALDAYGAAFDSSKIKTTQARSLLQRAMVFSTYLNEIDEAIATYQLIEQQNPSQAQAAHYLRGLLLFDDSRFPETILVLETYQKKYPFGKYNFQVEVLLEQAKLALGDKKPLVTTGLDNVPILRVLISKNGRKKTVSTVNLTAKGLSVRVNDREVCTGDDIHFTVKKGQVESDCQGGEERSWDSKIMVSAVEPIRVSMPDESKTVRGAISLKADGNGLRVLNLINIESYLRAVVPAESYASWPLETLKSQAVAARTYAYNRKLGRSKWAYDVTDDTWDQVYGGVDKEVANADRAVAASAGRVLVMVGKHGAKPIQTYFTANSGGYTSDPKAIFNLSNTPYLHAKPDAMSLDGKMASWVRKIKRAKIEEILKNRDISVGKLQSIEPLLKGPSGRLLRVRIRGSEGTIEVKSKPLLTGGGLKLPDVLVEITKEGDTFIFKGHGFGHGLGYSQWGGAIMGKNGQTYEDILSFYYAGAELRKLW